MTLNDAFVKNGKIRADGRMVHDFYLFQVKSPGESKGDWTSTNWWRRFPATRHFSLSRPRAVR